MVTGIVLVGGNGGGGARVIAGACEGELGKDECHMHEHHESVRKLLG